MIDRFDFKHFNDNWMFDNEDAELLNDDFIEDMKRDEEIENQLYIEKLKNKIKIGR